ncbi:MAG: alpha-isopropylmalate synthase regulatory domain-containing protein, partial [Gallicola sp.]|nr:alpha-isopropylmalate synthase regulatory domain-containing protein [Gallicola sp.]
QHGGTESASRSILFNRYQSVGGGRQLQDQVLIQWLHESGIHQHGVIMDKKTYEIMTPQSVGVKQATNLVLGKHSGKHAFRAKLEDLGYEFDDDKLEDLFSKFKELADKKKNIYEDDIIALASENMAKFIEDYKLLDYSSQSYSNKKSTTMIKLEYKGEIIESTATEDGPISAAFRAVQDAVGEEIMLEDFKIRSVTEGRDALGETTLRLKYNDKIFFGKGLSTDIIKSSILAYINGLNNVSYYKEKGTVTK